MLERDVRSWRKSEISRVKLNCRIVEIERNIKMSKPSDYAGPKKKKEKRKGN
jgi:hypothetical protein